MRQVASATAFDRLQWLATCVALLASAGSISIIAAAHVLPPSRLAEVADTFTPLTGHVLIGGLAALLALKWRRYALPIMTAGVAIALVGHAVLAQAEQTAALWPSDAPAASSDTLRVYALNSWDSNPDLPRLERALQSVKADVIVLTEADPQKLAMLSRLQSSYPYQVSCAHQAWCATAILSRLPIVASAAARKEYPIPPIAWARIDATALGLGVVTVVGTHVHRPTRDSWLHTRQMQALAALMLSTKGPVVLAGDFNTGSWSASFRKLVAATAMADVAGLQPTWPAYPVPFAQVALDHILISPDLVVRRSGIGPATGSDHLPVFAELTATQPKRLSAKH